MGHWARTFGGGMNPPLWRVVDYDRLGYRVTDCPSFELAAELFNLSVMFGPVTDGPLIGASLIEVTTRGPAVLQRWGRACTPGLDAVQS